MLQLWGLYRELLKDLLLRAKLVVADGEYFEAVHLRQRSEVLHVIVIDN